MIMTDHAVKRLFERYTKWDLDCQAAKEFLRNLNIDNPGNYEIVIIDTIPVVLICDKDVICTIYPHPIDMAEDTKESNRLRQVNKSLYNNLKKAEKERDNEKRKNKLLKQKLKGTWR